MGNEELISALNEQLSAEYQAIVQYIQYSAVVTGPHRPELVRFFQDELPDEQAHAQYLANEVSVLGGTPTTAVPPVPIDTDPHKLLENVLDAETRAVEAYTALARLADEAGEPTIRIQMEHFIEDESSHRHETEKILKGKW